MSFPLDLRLPAAVERTAYLIVVRGAGRGRDAADEVALAMRVSDECLAIDIDGVAIGRTVALEDRVEAAGGELAPDDQHLHVVLPCS